jgi:hypothetical protein
MKRYPGCLASGLGRSHQGVQQRQQRIDQSTVFLFVHEASINGNRRTHKNEDAISIAFPIFHVFVVLFFCGIGVY